MASKAAALRQAYSELAKADAVGDNEKALRTCNRSKLAKTCFFKTILCSSEIEPIRNESVSMQFDGHVDDTQEARRESRIVFGHHESPTVPSAFEMVLEAHARRRKFPR